MIVIKLEVFFLTFQKHLKKSVQITKNGISVNLLKILKHFLINEKQRVVLNGQTSLWINVNTGVPQR